ncbi:MAG: hypothetical protein HY856_10795 [Burkholderiales bacterium]|jgi:hypothetical protein|nr:hypothetical protein [Burkholderiales bacterium]
MTRLYDPTDDRRTAFVRGFWRGMAAPLVLFSTYELPPAATVVFRPLPRREAGPQDDWVKVGEALRQAARTSKQPRG